MRSIVLLMLLVAVVALAIAPELRERASEEAQAAWVRAEPSVDRLRDHGRRWVAAREAQSIAEGLAQRAMDGHSLPNPAAFPEHLRHQIRSTRFGRDPWGAPYFLELSVDSIVVGSPGEDGRRGTDRDVRFSVPRPVR